MIPGTPPIALLVGTVFGGEYTLVRSLDSGGMGAVFEARDSLGQSVALKIPLLTHDPKILARFRDEAAALAQLRHPNIVRVLRCGDHDGTPFMAMEFLHGESLHARIEVRGPMPCTQAVDIILPILSAIALVHTKGILHRDLKPENIFLARDDQGVERPVLIDFGIARLNDAARHARTTVGGAPTTLAFCAPERLEYRDRPLSPAFDQFTLGAVLFLSLTGHWFDPMGFAMAILAGQFNTQPLRTHNTPTEVEDILVRSLARDPAQRFASVRDMGEALLPFASDFERLLWQRSFPAQKPAAPKLPGSTPSPPSPSPPSPSPPWVPPPDALAQLPLGTVSVRSPTLRSDELTTTLNAAPRPRPWLRYSLGAALVSALGILLGVVVHSATSLSPNGSRAPHSASPRMEAPPLSSGPAPQRPTVVPSPASVPALPAIVPSPTPLPIAPSLHRARPPPARPRPPSPSGVFQPPTAPRPTRDRCLCADGRRECC